jgi:hypothetical protein
MGREDAGACLARTPPLVRGYQHGGGVIGDAATGLSGEMSMTSG